jgi:hypothetical protein
MDVLWIARSSDNERFDSSISSFPHFTGKPEKISVPTGSAALLEKPGEKVRLTKTCINLKSI